jgi:hypothetical protein
MIRSRLRKRTGRAARAGLLSVTFVVHGASAADGPGRLSLTWHAPPGCPDERAIRARVETLLGANTSTSTGDRVAVEGSVTATSASAELRLQTSVRRASGDPAETLRGERTIRGATCSEVSAAGALVIALAIDAKAVAEHGAQDRSTAAFGEDTPTSAATPTPTDGTANPNPEAVTAPASTAPAPGLPRTDAARTAPPPRTAEHREPTEGLLEGRFLSDVGSLRGPSVGAGVGAGFAKGRFATHLSVGYFFPRFAGTTPRADGRARGADVSLAALDLDGCYRVIPGAVELDFCAGLEAGFLLADGVGFDQITSQIAPWLGAIGSVEIAIRAAAPLTLRAGLGALVPFGRSRIRFREPSETSTSFPVLDRPGPVAGRATIGVGLAF